MEREKFYILDWAGNVKFNGEKFSSFDEAWSKIHEHFSHLGEKEFEEEMQEWQVLPCSNVRTTKNFLDPNDPRC